MSEEGNAERPRAQLEENLARDTVEQGLSATGLLLQGDKHSEVSRFQCMVMSTLLTAAECRDGSEN